MTEIIAIIGTATLAIALVYTVLVANMVLDYYSVRLEWEVVFKGGHFNGDDIILGKSSYSLAADRLDFFRSFTNNAAYRRCDGIYMRPRLRLVRTN